MKARCCCMKMKREENTRRNLLMQPLLLLLYKKESDMMMKMLCECVAFWYFISMNKKTKAVVSHTFLLILASLCTKKICGKSTRANAFFPLNASISCLSLCYLHIMFKTKKFATRTFFPRLCFPSPPPTARTKGPLGPIRFPCFCTLILLVLNFMVRTVRSWAFCR